MPRSHPLAWYLLAALVCAASVLHTDAAYAPDEEKPPGFQVGPIVHEANTNQIVLRITLSASANTIPVLYLSQTNWSSNAPLSDQLSQHPCEEGPYANSICCVNKLIEDYQVPPSMQSLYEHSAVCPRDSSGAWAVNYTEVSSKNAELDSHLKIGDLAQMDFVSTKPNNSSENDGGVSYEVVEESEGMYTVEMRLNHLYLKPRSRETVSDGTYQGQTKYEFYIGATFLTLSDSTALVSISTAQVAYEYFKSEFVFMSIATEQESTPVKQLDVVIHQGKSVNNNKLYQYIELDFEYETNRYPGAAKIQHDSLRWVKHAEISTVNSSEWTYPCTEETGYYYTGDRQALDALAEQDCLPAAPSFCVFNAEDTFYMPFPEEFATASSGFLSGPDQYNNLYLQFVLEITDQNGRTHLSTIFSSVDLQSYPVLQHCEDAVFYYNDVTDALKITATMGIQDKNRSSSVLSQTTSVNRDINEIIANPGNGSNSSGRDAPQRRLLQGESVQAAEYKGASSYAEATIAVEIDAVDFMDHVYAGGYSYRIDNMLIFNFLGETNSDYEAITAMIRSGEGFIVSKAGVDAFYTLAPNFGADVLCEEVVDMGGLDSDQLQCFWRRAVVANEVQPVAAESVYFYRDEPGSDATGAKRFITETVLGGGSAFDVETASTYFERTCSRNKEATTEARSYGCLYVDPGYRWISRAKGLGPNSPFTVSDKTVVVAIVTIATGDGTVLRRRLLSADASGVSVHGADIDGLPTAGVNSVAAGVNKAAASTDAPTDASVLLLPQQQQQQQPTRRLLAGGAQVNKAAEVTKSQGSSAFVCKKEDIDAHLSMFYMAGYGTAKVQELELDAFYRPGGDLRTYAANVRGTLAHLGERLGVHARSMRATGFTVPRRGVPKKASSRRLLATPGVAAKNYTDVSISTIVEMGDNFGTLYLDELGCALTALADQNMLLDAASIMGLVAGCTRGDMRGGMAAPMRSAVVARLSRCADAMQYMDAEECNQMRAVLTVLPGLPPVDTHTMARETPALTFALQLSIPLADATADASVGDMLRQTIAEVLGIGADRVLVQFEGRTLRRLLAAQLTTSAAVFVYKDVRPGYASTSKVNNGFAGGAWSDLRARIEDAIRLMPAMGFAAGASLSDVHTSPTQKPVLPGTSPWVVRITATLAMHLLAVEDGQQLVTTIRDALLQDMALPTTPAAGDVSLRSMLPMGTNTVFVLWVHVRTQADASALAVALHAAHATLKSKTLFRLKMSENGKLRAISGPQLDIATEAQVVDLDNSGDSSTQEQGEQGEAAPNSSKEDSGLSTGITLLIVSIVLVCVASAAYLGNKYRMGKRETTTVDGDTTNRSEVTNLLHGVAIF